MPSVLRVLVRLASSLLARIAGRSTRTWPIAVLLMVAAASARADVGDADTDAIYALIAGVVVGPPLVVALAVKRLRGVLQWLGVQVVWVGVLTVGFQLLRGIASMQ